jgi:glycosyltransferase involved in cell wall biosynthesis
VNGRLKILFIITRLIPGGAQRELLELLARLDRRRFHISLACHPRGGWVSRGAALSEAFRRVPTLVRPISPLNDLRAAVELIRLMRRERFHIVHTHTSKAGIVGRLAARLARVPVVVHTPHGTVFHESFLSPLMQRVIALAERAAACRCDCIITKSAREADEYVRRRIAPAGKFHTIHSGLDMPALECANIAPRAVRASLRIADGQPVVLYPARFVPEKDHASFLRAFEMVLESVPNAVAVLAGDGPLRMAIERQAAPLIQSRSLLSLGFREDVPQLMRAADLCVNASLTEGLPLTVAEALALGRPVVATDVGGTREIIRDGETGLLVRASDSFALGRAILRLLANPELARELGEAGQRLARPIFDMNKMIANTTELYENLWAAFQERTGAPTARAEMPTEARESGWGGGE